jgi:hypothetical protein
MVSGVAPFTAELLSEDIALEIEIIGLFGYERSQAAYTALASEEVAKAREILQSPQKYGEILSAPKAP